MDIKILGSGCANCIRLENHTKMAVKNLGIEADFEKVTDFKDIASYGVMTTPGLVVDGKVLSYGKVPSVQDIEKLLQK